MDIDNVVAAQSIKTARENDLTETTLTNRR